MRGRISGLIMGITLISTMVSPIVLKAASEFGNSGYVADGDLEPSNDFKHATAYTENHIFGHGRVSVSLFAHSATGYLLDYDGVNYHVGRANAAVDGGSSVQRYDSYHGIYDIDYNYIDSIAMWKP